MPATPLDVEDIGQSETDALAGLVAYSITSSTALQNRNARAALNAEIGATPPCVWINCRRFMPDVPRRPSFYPRTRESEGPSPLGVNNRSACAHSMISSARAISVGGRLRSSALAVFRLMTSEIFVGCLTRTEMICAYLSRKVSGGRSRHSVRFLRRSTSCLSSGSNGNDSEWVRLRWFVALTFRICKALVRERPTGLGNSRTELRFPYCPSGALLVHGLGSCVTTATAGHDEPILYRRRFNPGPASRRGSLAALHACSG